MNIVEKVRRAPIYIIVRNVLFWTACFAAGFYMVLCNMGQAKTPAEEDLLGVAVDADGELVAFFSKPAWDGCSGGEARKTHNRVGCWVQIDGEQVFFIMWMDGRISNVPADSVKLCSNREECIP